VSQAKQIERAEALRPFKPYPAYKDSGVEWLGEIPAHWQVLSLKRITSIRYGLGEPPQLLADGLPFVRATNVTKGRIVDRDMQFVDPKDVPWNRDPALRTGDIVVVRSGAYTGDSAIIPESHDGAVAGYDMVVRVRRGQPQFLAWALLSRYVLEAQIELESMRAAQPHLNAEELGAVAILLPPDSEQRALAAFLDRETARIDALVAKKERLVEVLQEQRTALITRAVTKGLDPNVPMKDSGVEWPGEIPAHWEVKPFTRYAIEKSDYRGKTPEKVASGVFLVTARNVRMGLIDYDCSQEFIAEDDYDDVMRRGVPRKDDLLFTTEAPLGNVALVDREDIALAQRIIRFRMNRCTSIAGSRFTR
jgi:type I restriction enzyme S subunit